MSINWSKYNGKFTAKEFRPDEVEHISPDLLDKLYALRLLTHSLVPSLAKGGLARFDGSKTSQHYAVGRKSTACDIFPSESARIVMFKAIKVGFGGIGIYEGTRNNKGEPQTMLHVDLREGLTLWARDKDNNYYYPQRGGNDEIKFFEILARV